MVHYCMCKSAQRVGFLWCPSVELNSPYVLQKNPRHHIQSFGDFPGGQVPKNQRLQHIIYRCLSPFIRSFCWSYKLAYPGTRHVGTKLDIFLRILASLLAIELPLKCCVLLKNLMKKKSIQLFYEKVGDRSNI